MTKPMGLSNSPGTFDPVAQEAAAQRADSGLEEVRGAGKRWLEIITALSAGFGAVALFGGPATLDDLAEWAKVLVGVLAVIGLALLLLAIYQAGMASTPQVDEYPARDQQAYQDKLNPLSEKARGQIKASITLTVAGIAFTVAAIGFAWVGPGEPMSSSWLLATGAGTPEADGSAGSAVVRCGDLDALPSSGVLVLVPADNAPTAVVPALDAIQDVDECPGVD